MDAMQWLTRIIFALTIVVVITNVIGGTLVALMGVGARNAVVDPFVSLPAQKQKADKPVCARYTLWFARVPGRRRIAIPCAVDLTA